MCGGERRERTEEAVETRRHDCATHDIFSKKMRLHDVFSKRNDIFGQRHDIFSKRNDIFRKRNDIFHQFS